MFNFNKSKTQTDKPKKLFRYIKEHSLETIQQTTQIDQEDRNNFYKEVEEQDYIGQALAKLNSMEQTYLKYKLDGLSQIKINKILHLNVTYSTRLESSIKNKLELYTDPETPTKTAKIITLLLSVTHQPTIKEVMDTYIEAFGEKEAEKIKQTKCQKIINKLFK